MLTPFPGDYGPRAQQDPSIRQRLEAELCALLYRQVLSGALLGSLVIVALTLLLLQVHPLWTTLRWSAFMLATYILRYAWVNHLSQQQQPKAENRQRRDLAILDGLVFVGGVGWGTAPWVFYDSAHPLHNAILMFTMAAAMGFGPQAFSARPSTMRLFTVTMAVGLIARLLADTHPSTFIFAGMVAFFAGVCVFMGRGLYLNLRHMVLLRLEKENLVRTLIDAKERAEENAAAKSDFLATVSHEIRTPMNGLMGMLEILHETNLTHTQLNYLGTATRSAEALLQLLNDILDFSKIEVGRLDIEKIPFDWINMVGEIGLLNRVLAVERGIGFHLEVPADGGTNVLGDPTRLRQVLNNLLSNALKFTHEGSVTLAATIEMETPQEMALCFRVRDTGIGIDAEAQKRLFQHFSQADASTSRKYGGTGLGLAISQRLTQLMGGSLSFSSEVGKGTEFVLRVTFPKVQREVVEQQAEAVGGSRFHARVLLAEDDAVSQRVALLMFKSFGVIPTIVDNGHEAIEQALKGAYDLIVLDCNLPGVDGFEAARQIRAQVPRQGIKPVIVALTASNRDADRHRALEAGMDDFMTKPVRKRDVRLCLERWLGEGVEA